MKSRDLYRQILDAYYEAEFADPCDQAAKTAALEELLDQAIKDTPLSRSGLVEAMARDYKAYRAKRKKADGIPSHVIEGQKPDVGL